SSPGHKARNSMTPIEYADASAQVRAVYDDIKATRGVPDVNNFWKYRALDPVVKEMVYLAVSVTNGCGYCIASHGAAARKAGMSEAMFGELMAVVGMANETNRLANGYRVPIDAAFGKQEDRCQRRVIGRYFGGWISRRGAPPLSGTSAIGRAFLGFATAGRTVSTVSREKIVILLP